MNLKTKSDILELTMIVRDSVISKNKNHDIKNRNLSRQLYGISNLNEMNEFVNKKYELEQKYSVQNTVISIDDFKLLTKLDLKLEEEEPTNDKLLINFYNYAHFSFYNHESEHYFHNIERAINKIHGKVFLKIFHFSKKLNDDKLIGVTGDKNLCKFKNLNNLNQILYKQTTFDINLNQNDIYYINQLLVARNNIVKMLNSRKYNNILPFYVYNYSETNNLRHFNMNLTERFNISREIEKPELEQHNYFDIYGYTKNDNAGVYVHFVTISNLVENKNAKQSSDTKGSKSSSYVIELEEYLSKFQIKLVNFMKLLNSEYNYKLYNKYYVIVVVIIDENFNKSVKEKFDYVLPSNNKIKFDIMNIKRFQYNPLENTYQPSFRLIKAPSKHHDHSSSNDEYNQVILKYGGIDSIPKMNITDPVNIYFGGKINDIFEIIRSRRTLINSEKDNLIHFDNIHRIVK